MTYSTLMVQLELGQLNTGALRIAGDLAERFKSHVVGVAACQPVQLVYGEGYVYDELFEQTRMEVKKELKNAEEEFRAALKSRAGTIEWRSTVMWPSIADFIAREARCADLIIAGTPLPASFDAARRGNTSDLVMQAGRPVLLVPPAVGALKLNHVLVAWKDTREARRAIADALPLLSIATKVSIVEIAADDYREEAQARLADIVAWLKRQGVAADATASKSAGDDTTQLAVAAEKMGADLIVAGAYGHSRFREWALGGVTRDLLIGGKCCALLSH